MKNKVYSSRFIVYLSLFAISLFFVILPIPIYNILINPSKISVYMPIIFISLLFLLFFCFLLNRLGYRIIYDNRRRIICKKGFIYGFFYEVEIDNIKDIIVVPFPKEGPYYVIFASNNSTFDAIYKKSFIRMEKTKKNREFIEQFWDKPIKEYKNYEDLFKQK